MEQKQGILQKLQSSAPAQIASLPEVADRFKAIYKTMNGGGGDMAATYYEAEKFHFAKILNDNPQLQDCTKMSLYGCFLDMAVNGLSFDPSMKHAYIVARKANVGTRENPKWEKRATLMIDGRGELLMRQRQGQVLYADNPVLVYEGDEFTFGTSNGKPILEHVAKLPRTSENIIACYLRITRPDGSTDYKVMSMEELQQIRAKSDSPNSPAWTKSIAGMFMNKTIKHAFRTYPKLRMVGKFTELATSVEDKPETNIEVEYGLPETDLSAPTGTYTPVMVVEPTPELMQHQEAATATGDDDFAQRNANQELQGESDDF